MTTVLAVVGAVTLAVVALLVVLLLGGIVWQGMVLAQIERKGVHRFRSGNDWYEVRKVRPEDVPHA